MNKQQISLNALDKEVYQQLKLMARKMMSQERNNHTLSATDLVHEAFTRLSLSHLSFNDQQHYFRTFARQMRRVLLNYAQHKKTQKHSADVVIWTESLGMSDNLEIDFVLFNAAIEQLQALDDRSAQAIELVYFTNLTQAQAAQIMDISLATLERDLNFGRVNIQAFIDEQRIN